MGVEIGNSERTFLFWSLINSLNALDFLAISERRLYSTGAFFLAISPAIAALSSFCQLSISFSSVAIVGVTLRSTLAIRGSSPAALNCVASRFPSNALGFPRQRGDLRKKATSINHVSTILPTNALGGDCPPSVRVNSSPGLALLLSQN